MDGADTCDIYVASCNVVRVGVMVWVHWDISISGAAYAALYDKTAACAVYSPDYVDSAP